MSMDRHNKGSTSNELEGEKRHTSGSRWIRLKEFIFTRPKHGRTSHQDEEPLRTDVPGSESGEAPKSFRTFKKTKTFTGIFGRGKGTTVQVQESGEIDDRLTAQPYGDVNSPTIRESRGLPEEETLCSTPNSTRYKLLKESKANRTIMFRSDLPPSSPLSTERLTLPEDTENSRNSTKSDENEAEEIPKQHTLKGGTSSGLKEAETSDVPRTKSSTEIPIAKPKNLGRTVFNVRLGSIALDDGLVASRMRSSPHVSPRGLHKRTSSLPSGIGLLSRRLTSKSPVRSDGTKALTSNDYESPWGVKDESEPEGEGDSRSSSKTFRVSEFVNGLKGWRPTHDSSNSFSLSDDDHHDARSSVPAVDMLEDEFVDYSVKQILKTNRHKGSRSKKWKA